MFDRDVKYLNWISAKQIELEGYFIDYLAGEKNELFITFENADKPKLPRPDGNRRPWGSEYLTKKGFSVLGVKPKKVDWYRGKDLAEFFSSKDFRIFTESFKKVTFYGSSMGGFAALVFSSACPGAYVIAFNPQSTLDPTIADWDDRFPDGTRQDWSGSYSDAKECSGMAHRIYVAYDPMLPADRQHVARLPTHNIIAFKMPFTGHVIMQWMAQSGIFHEFMNRIIADDITELQCATLARQRRVLPRYYGLLGLRTSHEKVVGLCIAGLIKTAGRHKDNDHIDILTRLLEKITDAFSVDVQKIIDAHPGEIPNKHFPRHLFMVLKRLSDLGFTEESLRLSLYALQKGNYHSLLLINISECCLKSGQLERAEVYVREFLNLKPDKANGYRMLGRILTARNQPHDALLAAQMAIKLDPKSISSAMELKRSSEAVDASTRIREDNLLVD